MYSLFLRRRPVLTRAMPCRHWMTSPMVTRRAILECRPVIMSCLSPPPMAPRCSSVPVRSVLRPAVYTPQLHDLPWMRKNRQQALPCWTISCRRRPDSCLQDPDESPGPVRGFFVYTSEVIPKLIFAKFARLD